MKNLKHFILETIDIFEVAAKAKERKQDANTTAFNEIMTMFGCEAAINGQVYIGKNIVVKTSNILKNIDDLVDTAKTKAGYDPGDSVNNLITNKKWLDTYKKTGEAIIRKLNITAKQTDADFDKKSEYKFAHPNFDDDNIWDIIKKFISAGQSANVFESGNINLTWPADIIMYKSSSVNTIKDALSTDLIKEGATYEMLWHKMADLYSNGDMLGISLKQSSNTKISMSAIDQNTDRFEKNAEKLAAVFRDPIDVNFESGIKFNIAQKVKKSGDDIKTFNSLKFSIGEEPMMLFVADIHVQHTTGLGYHEKDPSKDNPWNQTSVEIINTQHKSARLGKTSNVFELILSKFGDPNCTHNEIVKNLPDFKNKKVELAYGTYKTNCGNLKNALSIMIAKINETEGLGGITVNDNKDVNDILAYINNKYFNDISEANEFTVSDAEQNAAEHPDNPGLYAQYLLYKNNKRKTVDTAGLNAKIFIIQNIYALALMQSLNAEKLEQIQKIGNVYKMYQKLTDVNKDSMLEFFLRYMVANAAHIVGNTLPFIKVW